MIILNMKLLKILLPTLFLCIWSFILSFVRWFVRSCVLKHFKKLFQKFPFLIRSYVCLLTCSFTHSFVCSLSCSLIRWFVCSFVCISRKFHFFRHVRLPPAIKNCDFTHACTPARFHPRTPARFHARTLVQFHTRTHAQWCFLDCNASYLYFAKFGENDFSLKKIFGEKDTKNIWHFVHKRVKDSAAVGAWSYRWGLNCLCRIWQNMV